MKTIWEGAIPDEQVFYLQRLEYEIAGARLVVERLLREGRPENALFYRYEQEYRKLLSERGLLMRELMEEYLPEKFHSPEYAAHISFHTGTLQVVRAGKGACV